MQSLAETVWSRQSRWHIGDLAWDRLHIAGRGEMWRTRIWEADGEVLAWGWTVLPGELNVQVHPKAPELIPEVLDWFCQTAQGPPYEVTVLDAEAELRRALEAQGFVRSEDGPFFLYHERSLANLPAPELPPGFFVRPLRSDADVPRRLQVHRAAWDGTRVTEDSYRAVMAQWPYRLDLDWVAVAPDGTFVSECIIWFDEKNGVGEIEPTGTAPAYRRRGLGRATCLAGLERLRSLGATKAVVYARGDDDYPIPKRLYQGMGFLPYARTWTYRRG